MADLIVSTDSYVTLIEANDYVVNYRQSASKDAVAWNALSDADKNALLRQSCASIDKAFNFLGDYAVRGQKLEFPRKAESFPGKIYILYKSQTVDNTLIEASVADNGLSEAKVAQIENALDGAALGPNFVSTYNARSAAQIMSKKVGSSSGVTETYSRVNDPNNRGVLSGVYNPSNIRNILKDWISDSIGPRI